MSYEKQLMEMKKLLVKSDAKPKPTSERTSVAVETPAYEENWLAAGLLKEENEHGIVYKRTVEYELDYKHGKTNLASLQYALDRWKNAGEPHPLAPDAKNPLLFFDTETTGLKGVGTLIFLLGFLERKQHCFKLTQYVLPGPGHEAAFLYASKLWKQHFTLVTYNGKSFDIPQLETRWTMNRSVLPPLLKHAQIDLLHGSRRIWKTELDTFKLTGLEEEKLGFYREGDIPGHLAPIIYQDAVKSGNAEHLMKVLTHNEWDILSLVALYIQATALIFETEGSETAISKTNIGKWFADLKSFDRSRRILEEVIQKYGSSHPVTHFHFGFAMKKEQVFPEAIQSFKVAADKLTGRKRIIALEELAKLYEHKLKELEKALTYTKQARRILMEDPHLTERFRKREQEKFMRREMRIFRKLFPGEAQKQTESDYRAVVKKTN